MAGNAARPEAQAVPFCNRRFRKHLFHRWFHVVPWLGFVLFFRPFLPGHL